MSVIRYVIAEEQVARLFHDRPEDAVAISDGPLAVLTFLGFRNESTGGGCEASYLPIGADGAHVLVSDNNYEPNENWNSLDVGFYDADGVEQEYAAYWCDASDLERAVTARDDFVAAVVEYANRAERAGDVIASDRIGCDLAATG